MGLEFEVWNRSCVGSDFCVAEPSEQLLLPSNTPDILSGYSLTAKYNYSELEIPLEMMHMVPTLQQLVQASSALGLIIIWHNVAYIYLFLHK